MLDLLFYDKPLDIRGGRYILNEGIAFFNEAERQDRDAALGQKKNSLHRFSFGINDGFVLVIVYNDEISCPREQAVSFELKIFGADFGADFEQARSGAWDKV